MKFAKMLIGAVAASALYAGSANALVILNFDQARAGVPTGNVSFDGVRITGSDIEFDLMQAMGTGADGVFHCSNAGGTVTLGGTPCKLSFETGALTAQVGSVYTFAPGGSISMTGYLTTASPGNTAPVVSGSPITVSGAFDQEFVFSRGASSFGSGGGLDIKDETLLAYLFPGTDPDLLNPFRFAVTTISLTGCTAGATFTCQVTQADFQNTEVPEPASLALLGLGLLGIGLVRRRRG